MNLKPHERATFYEHAFPEFAEAGSKFVRGTSADGGQTIYGTFFGGQDYKNKSKLYGAYPPRYLERVFSLFPDANKILHLFSGSLTKEQVEDAWTASYDRWPGAQCASCRHGRRVHDPRCFYMDEEGAPLCGCPQFVAGPRPVQVRFDSARHPIAEAAYPDLCCDVAHMTAVIVGVRDYDLILADPPYRLADQRRYWREAMMVLGECSRCAGDAAQHRVKYYKNGHEGRLLCDIGAPKPEEWEFEAQGYIRFKPINKKQVLADCAEILMPGGILVWLDESLPMFSKRDFRLIGTILWVRSTNHRYRVSAIFEKTE